MPWSTSKRSDFCHKATALPLSGDTAFRTREALPQGCQRTQIQRLSSALHWVKLTFSFLDSLSAKAFASQTAAMERRQD